MSKFQRKLAEKMGEDTMKVSVKEWDELEALKEDYKSITISDTKVMKRQNKEIQELEKERDELKMDVDILGIELEKEKEERYKEQKGFNAIYAKRKQELQALKDAINTIMPFLPEPDDGSYCKKEYIEAYNNLKTQVK